MNINKAAAALGKIGGKAGTGEKKKRGDSEYYRDIQRLSLAKRIENKRTRLQAQDATISPTVE